MTQQHVDNSFKGIFGQQTEYLTEVSGVPVEAELFIEGVDNERTITVTNYWCEEELDLKDEDIKKMIVRNYEIQEELSDLIFDTNERGGSQGFEIEYN